MDRVVETDECWLWVGTVHESGYGRIQLKDNQMKHNHYAHKLLYQLFVGDIPVGHQINHHCAVKLCVNPSHLYAGTASQNMTDYQKLKRKKAA